MSEADKVQIDDDIMKIFLDPSQHDWSRFMKQAATNSKPERIDPDILRTAEGTVDAVYETACRIKDKLSSTSSTSAKNLRSEAKDMGDSTKIMHSGMLGN